MDDREIERLVDAAFARGMKRPSWNWKPLGPYNGAELAAGTCTDVSIPAGARWLPVGMTVRYLAKAKTDIRIVTDADDVDWTAAGNIDVPVAAYDTDGVKVFTATITMNVKH